jgi:molybdate/tungstate transport system substrate-binding protein
MIRVRPHRRPGAALTFVLSLVAGSAAAQAPAGPLVVFNAGSLAHPVRELLGAFQRRYPGVRGVHESSGSLEAARKLTELGKVPDVLAVADYGVIEKLLFPRHASWHAAFASNAMVLAYTERSAGAKEVTPETWWRVLLRPGVRSGHSNPSLDPNGYRTLMVFQLAESHYRQPGLSRRLSAAVPARYIRPKEADLTALLQAGELDYAWSYRSLATTTGLRWVELPAEINLSDPAKADLYSVARARLPGASMRGRDSVEFRGEPIVYALTIPAGAPHRATAEAFVRFVFTEEGQGILRRSGFTLLPAPRLAGDTAAASRVLHRGDRAP